MVSWYLFLVALLYTASVWQIFRSGVGFLRSVGWIFFYESVREDFLFKLELGTLIWILAAFISFLFVLLLHDDLDTLNNLESRIKQAQSKLGGLRKEIEKTSSSLENLKREKEILWQDVSQLGRQRNILLAEVDELEVQKRNLSDYIKQTLQKAYEEGREKGYQSVINELRSLRIQKSIILDLFDKNKEFKELLKKLTGKTIRQYLNEEKKKRLECLRGNNELRN